VHYTGWLADGTIVDSSYWGGQPMTFPLQAVVMGFAEGLQVMPTGATFQFTIPPGLAYGEQGAGQLVPPNSTLVFQVTLIAIED
jgi:FKBP-type peptidyl-prolyl cis-trans isomerase